MMAFLPLLLLSYGPGTQVIAALGLLFSFGMYFFAGHAPIYGYFLWIDILRDR